jgi:hypothetical protein
LIWVFEIIAYDSDIAWLQQCLRKCTGIIRQKYNTAKP